MNFNDLYKFIAERKIARIKEQEDKKKLEEYLLKCLNPKEVVAKLTAFDLSELSIDVYKRKIPGYYNLYDYILKTKNTSFLAKDSDKYDPDIFIPWILYKKSLDFLVVTDELLMTSLPNGEKIIEYLIDNNIELNNFTVNNIELAKIIYQKNKLKYLIGCSPDLYDKELADGKIVFDVLIENKILPINGNWIYSSYSYSYSDFDLLLKEIKGKTILEHLIDNNLSFEISGSYSQNYRNQILKVIEILIKKNKLELLNEYCDINFLKLKIKDENNVEHIALYYYIASERKLPKITNLNLDIDFIKEYINLGKELNQHEEIFDVLLSKIKKPKDLLLKTNDGITLFEIIISNYDYYKDVVKLLQKLDYIPDEIVIIAAKYKHVLPHTNSKRKFGIETSDEVLEYIYKESELEIDDPEFIELINNFYTTFNDNNSSKELLDLVVSSSKKTYAISKEAAISDLEALIKMKKEYPNFVFKYDSTVGSYFQAAGTYVDPCISINNIKDIGALNHEWGHLIDFLGYGKSCPKDRIFAFDILPVNKFTVSNYENDIKKAFDRFLSLADELLLSEKELESEFIKYINSEKGGMEAYKAEIRKEFEKFLGTEEMLLSVLNDGEEYNEVCIELIYNYFHGEEFEDKDKTIEMYVQTRMNIDKNYFIRNMFRKNNQNFLMYVNFLDAYYCGKFGDLTDELFINNKERYEKIEKATSFHSYEYFHNSNIQFGKQFGEMFADYVALRKSKNGIKYIELLKQETSQELINYLEEYYQSLSFKEELKK